MSNPVLPMSVAVLPARLEHTKIALHLCTALLMVMVRAMFSLACRGSCCIFALQMSYFAVGNTTMAVTDADVAPLGIVCNVTQVRTDALASGFLRSLLHR